MKIFLTLAAILEGLTGIALIVIPNSIVSFLLGNPTSGPEGKMTAMIAGAAIVSLAVSCWMMRETPGLRKAVKGMLVYNGFIFAIAIYGVIWYGMTNAGLWLILISHSSFFVWGAVTLTARVNHSGI